MNASRATDNYYNNNDNYDVSINVPEAKLQPERELYNGLFTPKETAVVEPKMAKLFIPEDSAKKSRQKDERGKRGNENDEISENEKDEEDEDEVDEPDKKIRFVRVEDEISIPEEIELEEVEPKKVNSYAAKKTVAQGMMDIALITANANQLRYIIEFNRESSTFFVIVTLISFSLILQVAVGMALIFKGRLDIKGKSKDPDAKKINNYVVVAIFLVTIINVFIASFTITGNGGKTN